MPAANIEAATASSPEYHSIFSPLAGDRSRVLFMNTGRQQQGQRRRKCCLSSCRAFMWRLFNCFRNSRQEQQPRPRPVAIEPVVHQYQAPVVTPSPRASGSVSSCDEDQDFEHGTLLPKRRTPEPGRGNNGAASSAAAAVAAAASIAAAAEAADTAAVEAPRHRRTGSEGARLQLEALRTRMAAAKTKFGTSEAEFATMTELLGVEVEDEDFCPTCLEAYTDDNPKIFTRCGHSFHMQCIYAWLERKNTCPLCESPMDLQDDILL